MKAGTADSSSRWLFGPFSDLAAGCGGAYMLVFLVLALVGSDIQLWLPATLLPLLAVVAGGPHYGATLLRAYERKEDRVRYRRVTVLATVALLLLFLVSLRVHLLGTLAATLYLLWSPWHYAGQNYGLMLMFLGRRGVSVQPDLKRWIHASFVLSFLLVIVQLNGETPAAEYAPGVQGESGDPTEPVYRRLSLGIPTPIQTALFWILAAGYLSTLIVAGQRLARHGSLRDLYPALALVLTQALWFSLPAIARHASLSYGLVPLDERFAVYTFHYIAAAHGIQYVWVTLYFHRKTHQGSAMKFFYGKSMLTGQLLWGLPLLVFAPLMVGSFSYSADLALLVAAIVNLHHFILDGAIWKLRDRRVGAVLLDSGTVETGAARRGRRLGILPVACAAGSVFLVFQVVDALEKHVFQNARERRDLAVAERALDRLRLVTRDSHFLRLDLGFVAKQSGDAERAIRSFQRSVELRPNPIAWFEKARLHAERGEWDLAVEGFEAAYSLAPFPPAYTLQFANALVQAGRRPRALAILNAELGRFPGNEMLWRARQQLTAAP